MSRTVNPKKNKYEVVVYQAEVARQLMNLAAAEKAVAETLQRIVKKRARLLARIKFRDRRGVLLKTIRSAAVVMGVMMAGE